MIARPRFTLLPKTLFVLAFSTAIAGDAGLLGDHVLDADSMMQWRLPDRLNEISGLAMTANGRLLAMNDEAAIVYELDYEDGRLIKAFALGDPVAKGDFEGIAVADDLVYLTTSDGRVYLAAEGADGQRVTFDTYDTGLGELCEIEGLTASIDQTLLYFLCKKVRDRDEIDGLMIFAWSIENRELVEGRSILLPERDILRRLRMDRLNPSGLATDRESGNFLIVAARQRSLIELSPDGRLVDARELPLAVRHRQPEGIEVASGERLLIADEGGSHRARLAVYYPHAIEKKNDD